jgi:hypothetical protein
LSNTAGHVLSVEFTILEGKLHRQELKFNESPVPHLLYSTRYDDAVSMPFPEEGKRGLSIFVGRAEQFLKSEVPLLWELEKKRGRQRMVVITNLRGKGFIPAYRRLQSCLGDPLLVPISFLRRRGQDWESLDFFSHGDSKSMQGAAPRLKRLKQRGWELVADRLSLTDSEIKREYFENLHVERPDLQAAFVDGMAQRRVSAVVGIAGQCLQGEHLGLLLKEEMNARILASIYALSQAREPSVGWRFLAKRGGAQKLILLSQGEHWLEAGDIMTGKSTSGGRDSELLVQKVFQRLLFQVGEQNYTVVRISVDWRYRPDREIPVYWKQNSTSPAGSEAVHG